MDLKKISELFTIENVVSLQFDNLMETTHYEQDLVVPYLRPSSMPMCSVLKTLDLIQKQPWREMPASMDFYVTIGTAVHEWSQRVIARSGKLLGHWNCPYCFPKLDRADPERIEDAIRRGTRNEVSTVCICRECEYPMEYEELTVEYRKCKGHVDTLMVDILPNKKIHLCDYKTTSVKSIFFKKKYNSIGSNYIVQLCVYAFILREDYGFDIGKISILYIARDDFKERLEFSLTWTDELHEEMRGFVDSQVDAFAVAKAAADSDDPIEHIEEILAHKACRDKEHYTGWMHEIMKWTDGCAWKDCCFTSRMGSELAKEIILIKENMAALNPDVVDRDVEEGHAAGAYAPVLVDPASQERQALTALALWGNWTTNA